MKTLAQIVEALRSKCRFRHLSLATEQTYVFWLRKFAHAKLRYPREAEPERLMEMFLTAEARRGVSATTQNQAFSALLFLYRDVLGVKLGDVHALRAKRPARLRHAPSRDDVRAILRETRDAGGYRTGLVVKLLYGCGLRVSEPLNLRIKDVCLSESTLILRDAKGGKDRRVAIPCSLVPEIKQQIEQARVMWRRDAENGLPVALPGLLARKYPRSALAWQWYWLFPAHQACPHPRTGQRVRWRMHEVNVQRCVKAAAIKAGLEGTVTPHHLRHAFATHAMQAGAYVRDIQVTMGHAQLETTMGYLTPETDRVPSPLETL